MPPDRPLQFSLKLLFLFVTLVSCALAFFASALPWYWEQSMLLLEAVIPGLSFLALAWKSAAHKVFRLRTLATGIALPAAMVAIFIEPTWQTGAAFILISVNYFFLSIVAAFTTKGCYRAFAVGAGLAVAVHLTLDAALLYVDIAQLAHSPRGALRDVATIGAGPFWTAASICGGVAAASTCLWSRLGRK